MWGGVQHWSWPSDDTDTPDTNDMMPKIPKTLWPVEINIPRINIKLYISTNYNIQVQIYQPAVIPSFLHYSIIHTVLVGFVFHLGMGN